MLQDLSIFVYDYIGFCYGGIYFLLALAAAFLHKNDYSRVIHDAKHELPKLPWNVFAYAVMFYGVMNWISIFASPFREINWILPLNYSVVVVSCFTLFKFASKASEKLEIKNHFSSKYLAIMLALAFIGFFVDARIGFAFIHLLIALPPIVQLFLVLYRINKNYQFRLAYFSGIFFILFLICRFIDYYYKTNALTSFEQIAGILISTGSGYHIASVVFFTVAACCFIKFAKEQLNEKNYFTHGAYFPICLIIFLVFGIIFTSWRVNYVDSIFKTTLMRVASGIARSKNIEDQSSYFSGTDDSQDKNKFSNLVKSYSRFAPMSIKPTGIFTLRKENGKYFVNNNGILLNHSISMADYNSEYTENIEYLDYAINSKTPVVVGPYNNRFGNFMTVYVPYVNGTVDDKTKIFGADIEAEKWLNLVGRTSTGSLLYLMFLIAFPVFAYVTNVSIKYSDSSLNWFFEKWYALALGVSIYMIVIILSIAYIATDYNQISNRQSFYCTADAKGQCVNEAINNELLNIKWILQNVSENKIWFNNNDEFISFAKKLNNYASINNLRLIIPVTGKNLNLYEEQIRRLYKNNDYYVNTLIGNVYQKIPEIHNLYRVYWPVLFTYPYDRLSLGFNYASFPHLKSTINTVLKSRKIQAVSASINNNISRFHGKFLIFGPSHINENGNIESIFVAFVDFQDIIDKINPSEYNENSNYDYEVLIEDGADVQSLASYPKLPDKKRIESWHSASLGYMYPIFTLGKTIIVKIYPKTSYSNADFWTTNTFIATVSAGIVFALVFSLFFVYQQIKLYQLEEVFEQKITEAEKRAGLVKEITEKLPVISYRLKKSEKDEKFDTIFVNSEIEKWTGISASEFINGNYSIYDIVHVAELSNINKLVADAVQEHKSFEVEGSFTNIITNEVSWGYGRAIPSFDDFGKLKWIDGFFIEVSEEKAADEKHKAAIEEIEKINNNLKEENQKINDFTMQVESSSYAKEALINNISNEVKNPIASIVDLSKKLINSDLSDEQHDYANIISNNSQNMLKIFNEINVNMEADTQTADAPSDNRA